MLKTSPLCFGCPLKKTIFRSRVFQLTVFLSSIFLLFVGSFLYKNVYRRNFADHQQAEFDCFLDELFRSELAADPLSLHFMITAPSAYDIQEEVPALTPYSSASEEHNNQLLAQRERLTAFSFEKLTTEQQQTYECLLFLFDNGIALSQYSNMSNPCSPQSGIQQQLPFLLSEYRFDSREDLDDYLSLLDSVYACFESLCIVMKDRFLQNTLPAVAVQNAAGQCLSFLCTPPEENILLVSFSERLSGLEHLDEVESAVYEMKNRYRVETEILPAYHLLYETLSTHTLPQTAADASGTPQTFESFGLAAHKHGKEYYTLLAQRASSSDLTVPVMQKLLEEHYRASLTHMKSLAKENPDLPQQVLSGVLPDGTSLYSAVTGDTPADTLRFLQQNCLQLLPALSRTGNLQVTLKTTAPCLQRMSAPAMYLLSPLDSYLNHTVYLNPAYSGSSSYTTIAHETFPGHLTARVCFLSKNPHPIRALTDFIGWDEGWASLAELYAIGFLTDVDAVTEFLCSYEIASLCLYGLSDIGIHYDGWSRQSTLDFWQKHGMDEETADKLWQLVVSEPTYYLPYSLGLVQMLELRNSASSMLGDRYVESSFCSALLSLGPMPYEICEKYLLQYLSH